MEFELKMLENRYFYWFLVAFVLLSGINMQTFAVLVAIAGLRILEWLFKDDLESSLAIYLPYFRLAVLYLFSFLLIPNFFWFSLVTLPFIILRSQSHEIHNTMILHLYIGIIAFLIQGFIGLLLSPFMLSLVPSYPLSLVVLAFLSLIPSMLYYFKTLFKIKKQYFYEDYNLFIYVVSYVIIMTVILTLPFYI